MLSSTLSTPDIGRDAGAGSGLISVGFGYQLVGAVY
jgi:hypothetical protein